MHKKVARYIIGAIVSFSFSICGMAISSEKLDPIRYIEDSFPKSIQFKNNTSAIIEFCPDNTCEGFLSKSELPMENLKDFAYLFIFYYSDYYVLNDWRSNRTAISIAKQIISKPQYKTCKNDTDKDSARCILSNLSQKRQIKLYFVRYDEKKRNTVERDLTSVMSNTSALQRQ